MLKVFLKDKSGNKWCDGDTGCIYVKHKKCMTLHTMMTTKVMCVGVDVHVLFSKCQLRIQASRPTCIYLLEGSLLLIWFCPVCRGLYMCGILSLQLQLLLRCWNARGAYAGCEDVLEDGDIIIADAVSCSAQAKQRVYQTVPH